MHINTTLFLFIIGPMSRKYYEKLLSSGGYSEKKVDSKIGLKLMKKMGWKEDEGLGKNGQGIKDCLQLKRRTENLGLGAKLIEAAKFKWNDAFWSTLYDEAIQKVSVEAEDTTSEEEAPRKAKKAKITE